MLSTFISLSVFAILAAATPAPNQQGGGSGGQPPASCSTGPIQCCSQVVPAKSSAAAPILGGLGIVVQDVNALVGLSCSPISVVGVGTGNACSAQTVCCENNSFGSLISIGCLPITL
ncbi:hydrophobin [Fomes fomentarius]|nr:hydrophobin [Fomes fomentarius]